MPAHVWPREACTAAVPSLLSLRLTCASPVPVPAPAPQQEGGGDDDDGGEYEEEEVQPSTKDLLVGGGGGLGGGTHSDVASLVSSHAAGNAHGRGCHQQFAGSSVRGC